MDPDMTWSEFAQQAVLLAIGALLTIGGLLVTSWIDNGRQRKRWEREQEVEGQREFERRLSALLAAFQPWDDVQNQLDDGVCTPEANAEARLDAISDYLEGDAEVRRLLVELKVASRDEEMLDLVQDAETFRSELAKRHEEAQPGGRPEMGSLLLAWQSYSNAIDELNLLNVRRKMPERLI